MLPRPSIRLMVYGGPTESVYQLCCALVRNGCEVRVLTTDANGPDAVLDVDTTRDVEIVTRTLGALLPPYFRRIDFTDAVTAARGAHSLGGCRASHGGLFFPDDSDPIAVQVAR